MEVYDCDSSATTVIIPSTVTYQGTTYTVTSIYGTGQYNSDGSISGLNGAFSYCDNLTSVTIPNSVTTIGIAAFFYCTALTSVTIPNSVTSIGVGAFYLVKNIIYNGTATGSPWGALSVNGYVEGDFVYTDSTKISLLAYIGSDTNVTIPNSVTSIGSSAFEGRIGLTSVTIGNSVTSIGSSAFSGCSGLTSVIIPNSVTSIGWYAFYLVKHIIYNGTATGSPWGALSVNGFVENGFVYADSTKTSLLAYIGTSTSVTIPNSVTSIGSSAFSGCSGLTSVTIGNSVTSIGYEAFYNCSGLTSVTIPNSVTSIGSSAFAYCFGLTSVTIPNSVTTIGSSAFSGCSGLTTLNFNAINCSDYNHNYYPFNNCPITTINIGDSVQQIPGNFAYNLDSLTSVTIPTSVRSIGISAFSNCNNLRTLNFNAINCNYSNDIYYLSDLPFYNCPISTINIGDSVQRIPAYFANNLNSLTSVTIPNSVTSIGDYAFYNCTHLTTLNFNAIYCNNFSDDYNHPFYDCPIRIINIGDSVRWIPNHFNYSLGSLHTLTIGQNITSINSSMIDNCTNLRTLNFNAINCVDFWLDSYPFHNSPISTINIGDNVQRIPAYFAYNKTSLTLITIPNSVTSIGNAAFNGCNSLSSATIGSSVAYIGDSAFSYCTDLYSIALSDSVAFIGNAAFNGCNSLEFIVLPNSVTSIGSSAFRDCSNLSSAIILNNIESIEDHTFYNCSRLSSITFNNNITSIGDSAFYNCSSLDSITIPNSVTSIGKSAFSNCANLAFATISRGINRIEESTFENCNGLSTITIPNSVANIADKAFNGCYNLREVVSLAVLPPALGANIFSGTAILKVPCGSANYYNSASAGWSQYFVGIEEMCDNITITVTSANESMGSVSGGGEYAFGTVATITAIPNQGYRFVSWNDGNTNNPRTITVTEDATYIANFEEAIGIEGVDILSELTFYPNPTRGTITFNRTDINKVEVLDAMGRTVAVYENAHIIDISKLTKGYYTMRITTAEGVAVRKVVRN